MERDLENHSGLRDFLPDVEIHQAIFGHYQLRPDGLFHIQTRAGDHELPIARAYVDFMHQLRLERGHKLRTIVDIRDMRSMPVEVRTLYASEGHATDVAAVALVTDGGLSRVIGNFAMRIVKTPIPQRLFKSVADAVRWLETMPE